MALQDRPKCNHIFIDVHTNTNVNTELSSTDNSEQSSVLTNKVCLAVAIKGFPYCKHHIKLYPEVYQQFLATQKQFIDINKQTKYNFLNKEINDSYKRKLSAGNELFNIHNDLALLTFLTERLVNDPRLLKTEVVIKLIDQQRKCIALVNELRKTTMSILTQQKKNLLMDRIVNAVNECCVNHPEIRQAIAAKFVEASKEFDDEENHRS